MTQQTDLTQAFRPLLTWLSRHVTTQYFIAGMTTVLFLVAWNRGIALLYGMVALLIAILAISYLLPHMGMRKLSVRLSGTHRCQHGGTLTFPIQLNSGSACRHIGISLDAFPDAIVTERPAFVSYVDGDSSANLRVSCHLRGEYRIEQLRACSSYPFGIHRACREVECNGASLLVHPRLFPLRELPYLGSSMQSSFGERSVHSINHYEDYAGAREYRHGDNPRHIHWAASARHRSLIVREFESHDLPALLFYFLGLAHQSFS